MDPSDDTRAAFFYGTLMAPEVFFTVCYRHANLPVSILKSLHNFQPAVLHGYCRRRVIGCDYPGIIDDKKHNVFGMYVTNLTNANMYHLDAFEGFEYERRKVKARLLTKTSNDKGEGNVEGQEKECEVYVFKSPNSLENREWDFEEFRTQKMKNWTREDYGFADSDRFAPKVDDDDSVEAAVCKLSQSAIGHPKEDPTSQIICATCRLRVLVQPACQETKVVRPAFPGMNR